eukprot:6248474-Prymnesium_polylepis.1
MAPYWKPRAICCSSSSGLRARCVVATSSRTVGSRRQQSSANAHVRSALRSCSFEPKSKPPEATSSKVERRHAIVQPSFDARRGRLRHIASYPARRSLDSQKSEKWSHSASVMMSGERSRQPTLWRATASHRRGARLSQAKQRASYSSTAAICSADSRPSAQLGQP